MGLRDLFRSKSSTPSTPQPSPGAPANDPRAKDSDLRAQGTQNADEPGRGAVEANASQQSQVNDRNVGEGSNARAVDHEVHGNDAARGANTPQGTEAHGTDTQQLPESGPLRNLVDILLSRGADRARLTLVQSGNVMTHQTRQAHGEAQDEVENGTVDQGSPLFDDVADLYTQAMNTPVGPWRQLDLTVTPEQNGQRMVTVDYAFPSGQSRKESYVQGRALSGHGTDRADDVRTGDARTTDVRADEGRTHGDSTSSAGAGLAGAGLGAAAGGGVASGLNRDDNDRRTADSDRADDVRTGTDARDTDNVGSTEVSDERYTEASVSDRDGIQDRSETDIESVRVVDGTDAYPVANGQIVTKGDPDPIVITADDQSDRDQSHPEDSFRAAAAQNGERNDTLLAEDSQRADSDAAYGESADRDARDSVLDGREAETHADDQRDSLRDDRDDRNDRGDLPEHVDESEFGGFSEPESPVAPTGAGAAALAADADPSDAPQMAQSTDVAPSYTAPSEQPSGDSPATGNLVLTLSDVQSRLNEAQRHLFGEGGTARDVSTVLIRVRALGTYYDALTHVRLNGFWDQRGTFDLVPENLLKVQELKDDSYVEGSGAPLAMMFRFRPGVPPEVSFDYSDEEAFVRYEQRLPGQNYLEELRMFPRTGSNIPQHMNDALQDWNY
ncbi:hypothetical protein [Kocuria carniphila]|uniref:hypothetical protein n=1 Tax=Kocuria carniphila TaxID=262208 RepID=UPI00101C9190|nr:hypothetical protein [Kocuria carniphila]